MDATFKPYSVSLHEPQSVCKCDDNPYMVSHIKSVLSRNVKILMSRSAKYNSNAKLAKAAGLGLGTINRILSGEAAAGIDTVEAVASKFHLTPSQLLDENLFGTDDSTAKEERAKYAASAGESPLEELIEAAEQAYQRGSLPPPALQGLIGLLDNMNPAPRQYMEEESGETDTHATNLLAIGNPPDSSTP